MEIYLIYDDGYLYAWSTSDEDIKLFKRTYDKDKYSVVKTKLSDEEYENYTAKYHNERELIIAEMPIAGFPDKRVALLPIAHGEYTDLQYVMQESYNQAMVEVFYELTEDLIYTLKDEYLDALASLGMFDAFEDFSSDDSTHDTGGNCPYFNTLNFILDHKILKFKGV